MTPLPSSLALTTIADGTSIVAADPRNNFTSIQSAVNSLISTFGAGAVGQLLRSNGAGDIVWSNSGFIYRKATQKDVVNTVAATDLLNGEITIGANVIGISGKLRCRLDCDYLNNSGGAVNLTIEIKFGATTLWKATITAIGASANRQPVVIEFDLANQNSAAIQVMIGSFRVGSQTLPTTGIGGGADVPIYTIGGSATEDTTGAKALQVLCTHSAANAGLSMRMQHATIEVV